MDDRARAQHTGQESGSVAERDRDDVRREPELRVEHRLQHMHRVTRVEPIGHHQRERPARSSHEIADPEPFQ